MLPTVLAAYIMPLTVPTWETRRAINRVMNGARVASAKQGRRKITPLPMAGSTFIQTAGISPSGWRSTIQSMSFWAKSGMNRINSPAGKSSQIR